MFLLLLLKILIFYLLPEEFLYSFGFLPAFWRCRESVCAVAVR